MNNEPIMIWEVVVVFEAQDPCAVDNRPNAVKPLYETQWKTKRKRYLAEPNGDDIGRFLSNFLTTNPIISVEVHQYQANLTPIETEES